MSKSEIIYQWNMFCLNYPHDFIHRVWAGTGLEKHFEEKFAQLYEHYGSSGAMIMLWTELDDINRPMLEDFAMTYNK